MNIDHMDAINLLECSIDFCEEFLKFINESNDGDHPLKNDLETFIEYYESFK